MLGGQTGLHYRLPAGDKTLSPPFKTAVCELYSQEICVKVDQYLDLGGQVRGVGEGLLCFRTSSRTNLPRKKWLNTGVYLQSLNPKSGEGVEEHEIRSDCFLQNSVLSRQLKVLIG